MHRTALSTVSRCLAAALAVLAAAAPVAATATYTYQGNPFDTITDEAPPAGSYDTSMFVTAMLTFQNAPGPNSSSVDPGDLSSWSFHDGRNTLTEANSSFSAFEVFTDANSDFIAWTFVLGSTEPYDDPGDKRFGIFVNNSLNVGDAGLIGECIAAPCSELANQMGDSGTIDDAPGTWTLVPEPGSALLLAVGLAGLGTRRLR